MITQMEQEKRTERGRKAKMMQKKKVKAAVISQQKIGDEIYDMWIETDLAVSAKAGQFICIYPRSESTLLPRPISICETESEKGLLRIVYRVAGKGTKEFSLYQPGDVMEILGNLGNGSRCRRRKGKGYS